MCAYSPGGQCTVGRLHRVGREASCLRWMCVLGPSAVCARLASGLFLWQGEVQALFLRHEGYLGAIGAFLKGAEQDSECSPAMGPGPCPAMPEGEVSGRL